MNTRTPSKVAMAVFTVMLMGASLLIGVCVLQAKEVKELTLLAGPAGVGSYGPCYGLSQIVNKHSTWLRLAIMETSGVGENLMSVEKDPSKTIGYASTQTMSQGIRGQKPYPHPMLRGRAIAKYGNVCTFLGTLDPNIKTVVDLKGKTVSVMYKGGGHDEWIWGMAANHGIAKDDIKITYLGFKGGADALLAGKIDATMVGNNGVPITMMPITRELVAAKRVYALRMDPADTKAAAKATGFPFYLDVVKKADNPGLPEDAWGLGMALYWFSDQSLDDEIVREICTILYDHLDELKPYDPSLRGLTHKDFTQVRGYPKEHFHPAALKFWANKGLQFSE